MDDILPEIQPATLRDLRELRHVERTCFPKDAWPLIDLLAVLSWPDVVRLKAVEAGRMVGFIAGDPHPSENMAWIATVGVLPECQRRGIGRALLRACEQRLKQPHIRLCVRASNVGAIDLYRKEGYQVIDTWRAYYKDKEAALIMEKFR
jgi:ribosomal-protein-alanine N-acetyltransferase